MIFVKAQHNALVMLQNQATFIGQAENGLYYILDGKVWAIRGVAVYRSDDDTETQIIKELCKKLSKYVRIVHAS